MRNRFSKRAKGNSNLFHTVAIAFLLVVLAVGHALAHVSLAEPLTRPGTRYIGHFKLGNGCSGSPTVGLRVEIPAGVRTVAPEAQPGWTLSTEHEGSNVRTVSWTGGLLPSDKPGVFTIAMTLPQKEGALLFPAKQICQSGEEFWSEAPPQTGKAKRPAPLLTVSANAPSPASVTVTEGWFRALPASVPSGGYFIMRNTGTKPLTLTDVETPACGVLMMHRSSQGGMEHVMSLEVVAGETLAFAPGGYHLMCMDAKPVLKPGARVPVHFQFAGNQSAIALFDVRSATGK